MRIIKNLVLFVLIFTGIYSCSSYTPISRTISDERYISIDRSTFNESNSLRANPGAYVEILDEQRKRFKGDIYYRKNDPVGIMTNEGVSSVIEAMNVLKSQTPLNTMQWSDALADLARQHVMDTGPKGIVGHEGSGGNTFKKRMTKLDPRAGVRVGGENISYGYDTGREVVLQLVVDDGVPSRGHRDNILTAKFNASGVSCGYHRQYGTMCVVIYGFQQ